MWYIKAKIATDFGNNITLKGGLSIWETPEWHPLNHSFYKKGNINEALELYFETDSIDEIAQLIEHHNLNKYHELIEEQWGQKTIRIYDPDNNLVEIGEKLETFIKRMLIKGLSIEEIHKKSGAQKELIQKFIQ